MNTSYGPVVGQLAPGSTSVRAFVGLPYALPPVGELRWQPPAPPTPWSTPLDVTIPDPLLPGDYVGPACPQGLEGLDYYTLDPSNPSWLTSVMSEDCLHLNVWTPCANSTCNLPVIVFLHGGSWVRPSQTPSP